MSGTREQRKGHSEDGPDLFTKLVIKIDAPDMGDRPSSAPGWLSPSITFVPDPPLPVNRPARIIVTVHNFGNMDATGVLMEVTYNIWIGNNAEAMQPITNLTLPNIPADGNGYPFEVDWTPPDTDATHACVHARVFDDFSLQNFTSRCLLWDSQLNPQAGNKNLSLVRIENPALPIIVRFKAKNFGRERIRARTLMTNINDRQRAAGGLEVIFPLPFRLERLPAELVKGPALQPLRLPPLDQTGEQPGRLPRVSRDGSPAARERLFRRRTTGLWPSENIPQVFQHGRFGLASGAPADDDDAVRAADRRSFHELVLEPDQEMVLPFVIPPEEFPPRGRRKAFQVYYQTDFGLPVVQHIFLYH